MNAGDQDDSQGCPRGGPPGCPSRSDAPAPAAVSCPDADPLAALRAHFADMIDHCLDHVSAARAAGRRLVGIMCEFTPREVILAAGADPVCLCGGSAATIPPAEQILPPNLCPLIKSTFGYHLTDRNPFLNQADLLVAETTCDGKKKMFELLGERRPLYVLELPQKADDADGLERWTREVRKFKGHLEERFGLRISDDALRAATALMNRERRLRRALAAAMARHPPPLTGRQLLDCRSIISGIEADLRHYERAVAWLGQTASAPAACGPEVVRVLLTGVPLVHGAERVLDLIEQCGAVVVAMENCTGWKPIRDDVAEDAADPLAAIAQKYYHLPCPVLTPNRRRLDRLRELAGQFQPDCVIELVWQACLTYDVESHYVRKLAEDELGLPYLKITTDYSPSDSARLTARIEALLEVARGRNGHQAAEAGRPGDTA